MKQPVLGTLGLLWVTGAAHGQELTGYFASTTKGWVSDLLFFEGNHFTYVQQDCTGLINGRGTFTVQPTTLKLHFDGLDNPPPPLLPDCASSPVANGIYVQVRDQNTGEPLPGVTVEVLHSPHGTSTSATGQAWFAYVPNPSDTLRVSMLGYGPRFIPLGPAPNCFQVQLGFTTYLRAGTIYTFPLHSLHSHSFLTGLHYRRISDSRARKMQASWERLLTTR